MLRELFAWWLRQMQSLVPERLRRRETARDATIIAVDAPGDQPLPASGVVLARRGGHETVIATLQASRPLAVAPQGAVPTGLRLPAEMVLHRDVVLPLAAERHLPKVLGYEMDRLTPFEAREVFWGVSGLRRDPARGLQLTLIVVLRAPVERLLETLGGINLRPSFLETAAGRIELAAGDNSGRAVRNLLYGLCAVMALLCAAIPVLRQQPRSIKQQTRSPPSRRRGRRRSGCASVSPSPRPARPPSRRRG